MTAAAVVLVVLVGLLLGRRQLAGLSAVPIRAQRGRETDVSIVIPARNEAASLPTLLDSLRGVDAEVVVVDDSSTDGTGDLARERGVTVVPVTALPPGWTGKAWACHLGAQATSRPVLVFLDADTELAPGALEGLLELLRDCSGLVSVQPFHRTEKAYEQLSCYFNVVSLMGCGAFARRPPRRAMAFGPCLITARSDYELAGGHTVVRDQILDDAQLAAAYTRAGLRVRCFVGGPAVRMRMYPGGPRQLAEGWTKNIAAGFGQADTTSALAAGGWVAVHFAVAVGAVSSIVGAVWSWGPPLLWWLAWLAVAVQLKLVLRRIGSFRWWTWVVFPIPLAAFAALFVRSLVRTHVHRSVRWRERSIDLRGSA